MPYHARRFLADLRGFRLWAAVLIVANLLVGFVAAAAAGEVGGLVAGAALGPRQQAGLSHLRVLDPEGSPIQTFESVDQLTQSVLDEPALALLMSAMESDERMFVVMYLQAFTDSFRYGGSVQSGIGVIGARPSWLPVEGAPDDRVLLWGQMPKGAEGVDDTHFGSIPVQHMSRTNLDVDWPGSHAIAFDPGDEPVVLFRPDLARRAGIGVAGARVADVLSGFTCGCDVDELTTLAAAMTRADREAGAGRVYYAVAEDQSVARTITSRRAVLGLSALALGGIALGILLFEHSGALVFWHRRRRTYDVEHRAGAPAPALHLRHQAALFTVVTAPLVTGVWSSSTLLGGGSSHPAPWHDDTGLVLLVLGLAAQVLVGLRPFLGLRRDCRPTTTGGRRA